MVEHRADHGRSSVVLHSTGHVIALCLDVVRSTTHDDAEVRPSDHRNVIRAITDRDGSGPSDPEGLGEFMQTAGLGDTKRQDIRPARPADRTLVALGDAEFIDQVLEVISVHFWSANDELDRLLAAQFFDRMDAVSLDELAWRETTRQQETIGHFQSDQRIRDPL